MGTVYKALEPALERYVAIKVLHLDYADDPQHQAQFLEEARAVAALRHNNIVPLYFVGSKGKLSYFAMAHIDGPTLEDWIHDKPQFDHNWALWFCDQAIAALDYANRASIIHLDIKPSNFLVDADNIIMLTDFGLATRQRVMRPDEEHELLGTPSYASPEHVMQDPADLRTDIYCMGATLFHLMSHSLPYEADTVEEICRMHVQAPFPAEKALKAGVPTGWVCLMNKMMEKKPEDRFQTYEELSEALADVHHFRYGELNYGPPTTVQRRRGLPRTSGPPETLYGLLPNDIALNERSLFEIKRTYTPEEVESILDRRGKLLPFNDLTGQINELATDAPVDFTDIVVNLEKVPKLRATVNDLCAFISQISDECADDDAGKVELLGARRTRNLALTCMLLESPWQAARPLDWRPFWQYSIASGLLMEMMVDMLDLPTNGHDYALGLFHSIGKLLLAQLFPTTYIGAIIRCIQRDQPLMEVEREVFGVDHARFAGEWMRRHRITQSLQLPIAAYEEPDTANNSGGMLSGVLGSNTDAAFLQAHALQSVTHLCKQHGFGFSCDTWMEQVCWSELPSTQTLFHARQNEDIEWKDFTAFFLESCRLFPELSLVELAAPHEPALPGD